MYYKILISIFLFTFSSLQAEIQSVSVDWTPGICKETCVKLLLEQFKKIPGVTDVTLNDAIGVAELKYKENAPFSYQSVKMAMRMVGVAYRNIRVRASGRIERNKNQFYLISKGDNTRFELVNPTVVDMKKQTVQYNQAAREVTPELAERLVTGQRESKVATIEGPLFMPERNASLVLTVAQLSFSTDP